MGPLFFLQLRGGKECGVKRGEGAEEERTPSDTII